MRRPLCGETVEARARRRMLESGRRSYRRYLSYRACLTLPYLCARPERAKLCFCLCAATCCPRANPHHLSPHILVVCATLRWSGALVKPRPGGQLARAETGREGDAYECSLALKAGLRLDLLANCTRTARDQASRRMSAVKDCAPPRVSATVRESSPFPCVSRFCSGLNGMKENALKTR